MEPPTGQRFDVARWGSMPYITKKEYHQIVRDLWPITTPGRDSAMVARAMPVVARVSMLRHCGQQDFVHLEGELMSKQVAKIYRKTRVLPDEYYKGGKETAVTPSKLEETLMKPQSSWLARPTSRPRPRSKVSLTYHLSTTGGGGTWLVYGNLRPVGGPHTGSPESPAGGAQGRTSPWTRVSFSCGLHADSPRQPLRDGERWLLRHLERSGVSAHYPQ